MKNGSWVSNALSDLKQVVLCNLHISVASVQVAVPKPGALKPAAVKLNKQRLRERLSQAVGIASSLVSPRRWSKQGAAGKAGYGAMGSSKGGVDESQGGLCPLAVPKVSTVSTMIAPLQLCAVFARVGSDCSLQYYQISVICKCITNCSNSFRYT
jgi:hypothetical protein